MKILRKFKTLIKHSLVILTFFTVDILYLIYPQDLTHSKFYYYDGNKRIDLDLDSSLVVEFDAPKEYSFPESKLGLQSLDNTAKLVKSKGRANIWKTNINSLSADALKLLDQTQSPKIRYSPVFRSKKNGFIMALPGNIVIEFLSYWSDNQIENWLATKGFKPIKKLDISERNFYEIETPAGIASLNIANLLIGQEGVVSSSPNWWREAVPK